MSAWSRPGNDPDRHSRESGNPVLSQSSLDARRSLSWAKSKGGHDELGCPCRCIRCLCSLGSHFTESCFAWRRGISTIPERDIKKISSLFLNLEILGIFRFNCRLNFDSSSRPNRARFGTGKFRLLPQKCWTKRLQDNLSRQDANETKSEIRISKSETNPKT